MWLIDVLFYLLFLYLDKPSGDPDNTLMETLTQMDPKSSSIELTLYGHDENQLLTAFGRLQELMREDYKWKDFDDPLLKDLNSQQVLAVCC